MLLVRQIAQNPRTKFIEMHRPYYSSNYSIICRYTLSDSGTRKQQKAHSFRSGLQAQVIRLEVISVYWLLSLLSNYDCSASQNSRNYSQSYTSARVALVVAVVVILSVFLSGLLRRLVNSYRRLIIGGGNIIGGYSLIGSRCSVANYNRVTASAEMSVKPASGTRATEISSSAAASTV